MTAAEIERLWDLVDERTDEIGVLTRKLLGEHLALRAQQGSVDADGEIVDRALLDRIRGAIGEDHADDVQRACQARLALDLLSLTGARL